jgi:hypothetical protein
LAARCGIEEGAMRRLLAMLLVVGATACQAPPSSPIESSGAPSDSVDYELSDLFNDWFSTNIASRCASGAVPEECAKIMLLSAFDESGDAGDNCPPDTGLNQFGECVIFGSFARELLARRDPGLVLDVDWLAPLSSLSLAFDTIANTVTLACYGSEWESLNDCYRRQLADSLGLPEHSAAVCGSQDVYDWKRCMLKEYVSSELLEASARI